MRGFENCARLRSGQDEQHPCLPPKCPFVFFHFLFLTAIKPDFFPELSPPPPFLLGLVYLCVQDRGSLLLPRIAFLFLLLFCVADRSLPRFPLPSTDSPTTFPPLCDGWFTGRIEPESNYFFFFLPSLCVVDALALRERKTEDAPSTPPLGLSYTSPYRAIMSRAPYQSLVASPFFPT